MTQIVSSISGIEIYAPSAGNAPTNSSEVSAIASAYQVVSATSTQLYVGTAYLTGVNSAPISAARAGNAANATQATTAWYDGTGRLISALPDSSTVSSIASSVASSYGSGKVDKSAISSQSASWNSVYNTVSTNSASWSGGTAGGSVVSPSGTIFVKNGYQVEGTNSAVTVTQTSMGMTSTFTSLINAIGPNGMMSLSYSGPTETGMNLVFMLDHEYHGNAATVVISARDNNWNLASASGLIVDGDTSANIPLGTILSQLSASSDYWVNLKYDQELSAVKAPGYDATGVGELAWQSALTGVSSTVANNSATWGQGGVSPSTVSSIASSYASSAVSGVEGTVSANSATWNNTGVSESTVSSIASSYAEAAASSKADSASLSAYALSADVSATVSAVTANSATWGQGFQYGNSGSYGANTIGIGASGAGTKTDAGIYLTSTHGTGFYKVNELTLNRSGYGETVNFNLGSAGSQVRVSASGTRGGYFSAWNDNTEAALVVSGAKPILKLGAESATDVSISSWNDCYDTVSGNSASWGQGGVDSATVSSIASSYAQDVSAAVSGTVDTVSSQSANWGGSALELSAGPGVTLTKSGGTLIAGLDQTVLWSGTAVNSDFTSTPLALSESMTNFDSIKFYWQMFNASVQRKQVTEIIPGDSHLALAGITTNTSNSALYGFCYEFSANTTGLLYEYGRYLNMSGSSYNPAGEGWFELYRVVGVNRTANN